MPHLQDHHHPKLADTYHPLQAKNLQTMNVSNSERRTCHVIVANFYPDPILGYDMRKPYSVVIKRKLS